MVAYNFQGRFANMVQIGVKRQTIRRNASAKVGDRLQLYTGQRTKHCRKLVALDPVVIAVHPVVLQPHSITINKKPHFGPAADEVARDDGFTDYAEMWTWFKEKYCADIFHGVLTKWQSFSESKTK